MKFNIDKTQGAVRCYWSMTVEYKMDGVIIEIVTEENDLRIISENLSKVHRQVY